MNFYKAVEQCRHGLFIRRSDWGYPLTAHLAIHKHMGVAHIYIYNIYDYGSSGPEGYGITLSDIDSTNWEIVTLK